MALPFMFTLRILSIPKDNPKKALISVHHRGAGQTESGFSAHAVFEEHASPWRIVLQEIKGGEWSLFSPAFMAQKSAQFEAALSYALNEWYADEPYRKAYVTPDELHLLHEQVLVLDVDPAMPDSPYFIKAGSDQTTVIGALQGILNSHTLI